MWNRHVLPDEFHVLLLPKASEAEAEAEAEAALTAEEMGLMKTLREEGTPCGEK